MSNKVTYTKLAFLVIRSITGSSGNPEIGFASIPAKNWASKVPTALYHIIRIFKEHFEIKEFLEQMFSVLYVKLYLLVENGY